MAFTPEERAKIRKWLCGASVFRDFDTRLESAITAVEGLGDSGATELMVRGYLTDLDDIETQLKNLRGECLATTQVNKIQRDGARALLVIRSEGRRIVGYLARTLSYPPAGDPFSGEPPQSPGWHPFDGYAHNGGTR
jgi:hypothetical protein